MSHAFNVASSSSSASVPQQSLGAGNNHPGDYAEPLVIKEWVKTMRAEYDKTNLAPVLADEVPASIRRQTEPVPLSIAAVPAGRRSEMPCTRRRHSCTPSPAIARPPPLDPPCAASDAGPASAK